MGEEGIIVWVRGEQVRAEGEVEEVDWFFEDAEQAWDIV